MVSDAPMRGQMRAVMRIRPAYISRRGNYEGEEALRLATLKFAAILGAPFIDVEFKSAATFFASA